MDALSPAVLLQIPVFLFSLTLHEFAHAWTAKKGGDMTAAYLGRLSLNPLVHIDPIGTILLPGIAMLTGFPVIGWAKPVPVTELRFRRSDWIVWVSLAGPFSNVLLAAIAAFLMKAALIFGGAAAQVQLFQASSGSPGGLGSVLFLLGFLFIKLNILLAVFNMLPIPPLDGSKLVYYYFIRPNPKYFQIWVHLNQMGLLLLWMLILLPPFKALLGMMYTAPVNIIVRWIVA